MEREKDALDRLGKLKETGSSFAAGVPVSLALGRMPLTDTILEYAKTNDIDLVVMGTYGATGLKKVVMGSVASGVAEESEVPVLLVPDEYKWAEPEHFVFATNFEDDEYEALQKTVEWAKACNAKLTVLHLCASGLKEDEKAGNRLRQHMRELEGLHQVRLEFQTMLCGEVDEAIEHLDDVIRYDLLVMVRRSGNFIKRLFSGSLTRNVALSTHLPLLVVPSELQHGNAGHQS
jgi:nucleotide-binding universal stress UspA family protein